MAKLWPWAVLSALDLIVVGGWQVWFQAFIESYLALSGNTLSNGLTSLFLLGPVIIMLAGFGILVGAIDLIVLFQIRRQFTSLSVQELVPVSLMVASVVLAGYIVVQVVRYL